jgi:methyltransferase-like protein/SAM-dependent methyltransferase
MADQATPVSYDQVPYPSLSYTQSHPSRLATLAILRGLEPVPVERCRVLELGCASGGNLIPMAYGLPGSTFVGIDNSAYQIAEGQKAVKGLGLGNATLQRLDILDVGTDMGQFDYVIAHGVFSWIPQPVQEKLLQICKQNLAPNGVAYVSYNAYPGWHMMGIIRDMMLYHTRDSTDPEVRATQARALLDFLAESIPDENSAYGSFLATYARLLHGELKGAGHLGNAFLLHDELEIVNEPLYFYQFAERAQRHGLQYLGEAEFSTMVDTNFPPHVSEGLREMSRSAIDLEQYMDFLRNRTFRQTLLCHQDHDLRYMLRPEQLHALCLSSRARISTTGSETQANAVQFCASDGATLSTDHPLTQAAMRCLADIWPQVVPFDALLHMARSRLGQEAQSASTDTASHDALVLGANLLKAYTYSGSLVELYAHVPPLVTQITPHPSASPVARWQSQAGSMVTNLRHERVHLDPTERYLLPFLDGTRDLTALETVWQEAPHDETPESADLGTETHSAAGDLVQRLRWLARAAVLIG